jgi:flagellar M-ring protein FliF
MAQWLEEMPMRSRVLLASGVVLVLATTLAFAWWATRTEYSVLFGRLTESDAAGIVGELKKQKVEYQLADGGTTIRVPAVRVHDVRLALMSSGTPIAGGVGFEIFDRQGLGATEQSQRVSYQRALQGELARTVGALEGVQQARVHLVLPESTLFRRERQEARASVSLKLEPGVALHNAQIFGIQRLVAAAVPGLDIGRVVVTDQHGLTLSAADALTVGAATGEGRLSMKREVEDYVTRKIVALLDRAYGPGRAIVSVDATLNFDEVRRTVQDLIPAGGSQGTVRRRRQTTAGNVTDPNTGFDNGQEVARGTSDTEYDYGRSVEQVVAAPGGVTRLSVGVIVPGAIDVATQERIEDMVRVAAGVNEDRGDVVVVQSLDGIGSAVQTAAVTAAPVEPADVPTAKSEDDRVTDVVPTRITWWNPWYAVVGFGLLVTFGLLTLSLRGRSGRLTSDQRALLLTEVKASLERGGPRMNPAGGAL